MARSLSAEVSLVALVAAMHECTPTSPALPTMWHIISKDEPAVVSAVTIIYSIEDG